MNTTWNNSFTIYPEHCNYMNYQGQPMVHGGSMLMQMDRTAAECARRLLYTSECDSCRTVGLKDLNFWCGASLGDIILIKTEVISLGKKSIRISVKTAIDKPESDGTIQASGIFTFVSFLGDKPHPHGLVLDK